jgi:uncharacterized protein YdaU (DUF1376 family)
MALGKPTWFKMDPAAFLSDGQIDTMSTIELGACFRLLCRQWLDGHIPDDQHVLARLCRLDADSMAQAWQTLSQFFPVVEPGKRANRFMWIEREKVIADLERKSDEGRRAAHKLWAAKRSANPSLDALPSGLPNGSPMPDPMQEKSRVEQSREENTFPQTAFAGDRAPVPDTHRSNPTETQLEQLYSLYPRKRDKLAAKKAIRKAVGVVIAGDPDHPAMPIEDALNYIAQRIALYARCVQGCDREFIPYPASWFNAGSFWDDEQDWSSRRNRTSDANGIKKLPPGYVSEGEKRRQEINAWAGDVR